MALIPSQHETPFPSLIGLATPERPGDGASRSRHGTRHCYVSGCRRPECRRANADYMAAKRAGLKATATFGRARARSRYSPEREVDWVTEYRKGLVP